MKVSHRAVSFLALIVCALAFTAQPATWTQAQKQAAVVGNNIQLVIEGKVINVHDGDTVTVLDQDNKKTHIRLQGIDAPELKQEFGAKSQEYLSRIVLGKQVTIVWTKVDKYRRTVGTIMLDGRDINIEQVKAGLAWHFKKYEDEQKPEDRRAYAAAEQEARAGKLGLWKNPNPIVPGDWRQDVKIERWGPPPPEGTIVGNRNSKKYHRPDCPGYRDMAERNRVFFKSVAEAEAAGYKRAGNCPAEVTTVVSRSASGNGVPTTSTSASLPITADLKADSKVAASNRSKAQSGAQEQIIGNMNSKIYHVPGCSTYNSVSEKNRAYFVSAEEAEKAGYRKSKACH